jgi:hypothetical protein
MKMLSTDEDDSDSSDSSEDAVKPTVEGLYVEDDDFVEATTARHATLRGSWQV